jgi:SAM-dependent methyltransferase
MGRPRRIFLVGIAAVGAMAFVRRRLGRARGGRETPGGILMRDTGFYDRAARLLLRPFFRAVAADVAATVPTNAKVLEVGCGPGHLAIQLAGVHGLEVTGVDLDPAMIARAEDNAARSSASGGRGADGTHRPSFRVADVAALPFGDETFDAAVSTMSMHHWTDPTAGLDEIARVLRPGARLLIWDLRPGSLPFHPRGSDPVEQTRGSTLELVSAAPWRWPLWFDFTQRIELVRPRSRSTRKARRAASRTLADT